MALELLVRQLAERNRLTVKRIRLDTFWHPHDTAVACVEFVERDMGDGVYLFSQQVFRNSNWPDRFRTKSLVADYPKGLGLASAQWTPEEGGYSFRKLKVDIGEAAVFVYIGDEIAPRTAKGYITRFIQWTRDHPDKFKHKLSRMSRLEFDEKKQEATIFFDDKLSGTGYNFDVAKGRFVIRGWVLWAS